jgi:CubicO group peptidase (beta-lactamase class C family)
MSKHPRCRGAFSIAISAAILGFTSSGPVNGDDKFSEYDARLGPLITRTLREEKIPGFAIGVVEGGKLVYARGFGVMKLCDPTRPITPDTLFHMASITKPFVATAIMQLVEQGKIDLDAPVTRYVPYFRLHDPRYTGITIRHMLTHTSGMPDVKEYCWNKPEYDEGALECYVRSLQDKTLFWQPGQKFRYSNMAFEVLGDLIAKVSGISFEDYIEMNILKPVGMNSSTLLYRKADPAKLASGYTLNKGAVEPVAHYPYNRAHTPSSNLHSNVNDMARWMLVNLDRGTLDGRRILKSSTYDILWKPAVPTPERNWHVGMSWFLAEVEGDQVVMHSGGDDGFGSHLAFSPARKAGVVMMWNSDEISSIKKIWQAALGKPPPF